MPYTPKNQLIDTVEKLVRDYQNKKSYEQWKPLLTKALADTFDLKMKGKDSTVAKLVSELDTVKLKDYFSKMKYPLDKPKIVDKIGDNPTTAGQYYPKGEKQYEDVIVKFFRGDPKPDIELVKKFVDQKQHSAPTILHEIYHHQQLDGLDKESIEKMLERLKSEKLRHGKETYKIPTDIEGAATAGADSLRRVFSKFKIIK